MTRLAIVGALVLGLAGCTSTTWTAQSSVNPVLLGPVHRIGGAPREPTGTPVAGFASQTATFYMVSSKSESKTTGHGRSRRTVTRSEQSTYASASGETKPDWDVVLATGNDLGSRIVVRSFVCSGWDFFFGFYMSRARCEATGQVFAGSR